VVKIVRNGQARTVTVKLGERPPSSRAEIPNNPHAPDEDEDAKPLPGSSPLGLEVETFTARKADQLGLKLTPGVIITGVNEDGVAYDAGLRINFIILRVNDQPVATVEEFNRIMKGFKSGDEVLFQIARRLNGRSDSLTRDYFTVTIP
jgi:serine protease Do